MSIYIYRSTDTSAPVLTQAAGSFISLLDACLVNGYADKTAVGWTKEYTGSNIASYKMKTGTSGCYFNVDDTGTISSRIRGYKTASAAGVSVSNGTYPFPNDYQLSGGQYFFKAPSASAVP